MKSKFFLNFFTLQILSIVVESQNVLFILSEDGSEVTIKEDVSSGSEINYIFETPALTTSSHTFTNRLVSFLWMLTTVKTFSQEFAIVICCMSSSGSCVANDTPSVEIFLNFVLRVLNWTDLETLIFEDTCFSVLKDLATEIDFLYLIR